MEFRYLDDYRRVYAFQNALNKAAERSTLSLEELEKAVYTISTDDVRYSIGTIWILENPEKFVEIVSDVFAFLEKHFDNDNHYFTRLILFSSEILSHILEEKREAFIRKAHLRYGDIDTRWIDACLQLGISEHSVREMIIDRLEAEAVFESTTNDLNDFLRYGNGCSGIVEVSSPWHFLGERLFEALMICAEKSPKEVLKQAVLIREAASGDNAKRDAAEAVLVTALDHLSSPICLDILAALPLTNRLALAQRLKDQKDLKEEAYVFLVELVLSQGKDFFHEMLPILERINGAVLMQNTWALIQKAKSQSQDFKWLEDFLHKKLLESGYKIGVAKSVRFFDRRTNREREQIQVVLGKTTYVQDLYSNYYPKEGETVIFHANSGRQLARTVIAVNFRPAFRPEK